MNPHPRSAFVPFKRVQLNPPTSSPIVLNLDFLSSTWLPGLIGIPDTLENRVKWNQVCVLISQMKHWGSSVFAQPVGFEQMNGGKQSFTEVQGMVPECSAIHDTDHGEQMYSNTPQVTPNNMRTQQDTALSSDSMVRLMHNGDDQARLNYSLNNEARQPISNSTLADPSRNVKEQDSSSENDTSSHTSDVNNEGMITSSYSVQTPKIDSTPHNPQQYATQTKELLVVPKEELEDQPVEVDHNLFPPKSFDSIRDPITASSSSGNASENFEEPVYQRNLHQEVETAEQVPRSHPFIRHTVDHSKTQKSIVETVQSQREMEETTFEKPRSRKENRRKRGIYRMENTGPSKKDRKTAQLGHTGQNSSDFETHMIPRSSLEPIANQCVEWIPLFLTDHRRNDFPCPDNIPVFMNPHDPYQRIYMIPGFHALVFVNHREPDWRMHFDPNNPAHRTQEYENQLRVRENHFLADQGYRAHHPQRSGYIHQTQMPNNQHQIVQNSRCNPNQNVQVTSHQQHPNYRGSHDLQNSINIQHHLHIQTESPSHHSPQMQSNINHQMKIRAMTPQPAMQRPTHPYQTMPNASNPGVHRCQSVQPMLSPMYQPPPTTQPPNQPNHQQHLNNRGPQDFQNARHPQHHMHIQSENSNRYPHQMQNNINHQMQIRGMTPQPATQHSNHPHQTMPNGSNPGSLRCQSLQPMLGPMHNNPRNLHYSRHQMQSLNFTSPQPESTNSHPSIPDPNSASPLFFFVS